MKLRLLFFFLVIGLTLQAQIKLCSWNLCDLGKSKSGGEIAFMAERLSGYDLVAIQEVVSGPEGAKAIARLADALNRKGAAWDYRVSDPTQGTRQKQERYAFLWKTSRIRIKKAWLDSIYKNVIEREPFFGVFVFEGKEFTVVNFHAITKKLQPETEIKYFKNYPAAYPEMSLIFCGDFNCPEKHSVFNPIKKMGFQPALSGVRTTLKQKCSDSCTASEFDNFFFRSDKIKKRNAGADAFYKRFPTLKEARQISDHLPVYLEFEFL